MQRYVVICCLFCSRLCCSNLQWACASPCQPALAVQVCPRCSTACQLHVLLHRQWDLSAATATGSSIRVLLWHVTAVTSVPREPHALTPAASFTGRAASDMSTGILRQHPGTLVGSPTAIPVATCALSCSYCCRFPH